MRPRIFLGCWLISLINGKYILVDVEDGEPTPDKNHREPVHSSATEVQCTGQEAESPWSHCSSCVCKDGCITEFCTRSDLSQDCQNFKHKGELYYVHWNNCHAGTECVKVENGVNGKCKNYSIGKCTRDYEKDGKMKPNPPSCIPPGGRCSMKKPKKLSITFDFRFRSSNDGKSCCKGSFCLLGKCLRNS